MTQGTKNAPARLNKETAISGMKAIQATALQVQQELMTAEGFERTLTLATGLVALQEAMTDETVAVLKALEGNEVGFKTDKDGKGGGYDAQTIKECAVRALLHGAHLHGNEFNIIAGGCYLTQQYYLRRLREYPDVSDVQIDVDIPVRGDNSDRNVVMLVGGYASCKVDGKKVEIYARESNKFGDQRIAVSAFQGDIDQAQGKAKKRLAQRLYERIAGVAISEESESGGSVLVVEAEAPAIEHEKPATNAVDWSKELMSHGGKESVVFEIGCMLRDAPSDADRADVMAAAKNHLKDGGLDQRGFDTLKRYAEHKNAEEVVAT